MREVIIIGGGLTGLAAAHELEQRLIPYTLIEVKNRLGGSVIGEPIDTLTKQLTGNIMLRMAVTSLGKVEGRYAVCLENGLALSADALIVAAPARYAERMFRTLQGDIALMLSEFEYDTTRAEHWPNAYLIGRNTPVHAERLQKIAGHMPEGVALVGSDYLVGDTFAPMIAERVAQGREAASRIAALI